MGRTRIYQKHDLPSGIVSIAISVISDYDRRKKEISKGALSESVLSEYARLNLIVDGALLCVENSFRDALVNDIIHGNGYRYSMLSSLVCKTGYYDRKRTVIYLVAVGLGLWNK